jgi:hypothetical protein
MNRKNLAILAAAVVGVAGFAAAGVAAPIATGPTVSLQFAGHGGTGINGNPYQSIQNQATVAGAYAATYWNYQVDGAQDAVGSYVSTASYSGPDPSNLSNAFLVDSTGASSTVSYSYAYTRVSGTSGSAFTGGDAQLAGEAAGVQNSGNATLTLSGLAGTYDIIAEVGPYYFGGGSPEEVGLVGGANYYLNASSSLGTWVQATATSAGTAINSNYVEFDNLTGVTQSLTVFDNGHYYGLNGVQIVPVAAASSPVPEPASLSILVAGISALTLRSRRRRA